MSETEQEPVKPHWKTIMAGNIAIAGGYCWCDSPDGDYHSLRMRPKNDRTDYSI